MLVFPLYSCSTLHCSTVSLLSTLAVRYYYRIDNFQTKFVIILDIFLDRTTDFISFIDLDVSSTTTVQIHVQTIILEAWYYL